MITSPLLPGHIAAHFPIFALLALAALYLLALIESAWKRWRARRNDNQVDDDRRLRAGMKGAARRGWLPEDTQ
jgi:hypothetical protein